jgi:rRNA-processing protein FCF1
LLFIAIKYTRIFEINARAMTTKLTLTIEDAVIKRAKHYAKHTGKSISALVEQYLDELTTETSASGLSSGLQNLVGSVRLPEDFDEEKELRNYMENKHL